LAGVAASDSQAADAAIAAERTARSITASSGNDPTLRLIGSFVDASYSGVVGYNFAIAIATAYKAGVAAPRARPA
jgi:hypothetical protein